MNSYLDESDLPPQESSSDEEEDGLWKVVDSWSYRGCRAASHQTQDEVRLVFSYSFCGGPIFEIDLYIPGLPASVTANEAAEIFSDVGLVALTWLWMARPARKIVAKKTRSSNFDWRNFYREAFAEWAFVHEAHASEIDVDVDINEKVIEPATSEIDPPSYRFLCGLGGGKDGCVARFLTMRQPRVREVHWIYVGDGLREFSNSKRLKNMTQGDECLVLAFDFKYAKIAASSGRRKPLGHPWAALVAFASVCAAEIYGYDGVVVGNERSANFGNGVFVGQHEVNHQFDKTLAFERRFQKYAQKRNLLFFSPLSNLWELQIAAIFAKEPSLQRYWTIFRSCNDSGDVDDWCGKCVKCAFIFAIFSAFRDDVTDVFNGQDLFHDITMLPVFESLIATQKPFDCIGTAQETNLALCLAKGRARQKKAFVLDQSFFSDKKTQEIHLLSDYDRSHHALPPWWQHDPLPRFLMDLRQLFSRHEGGGTFEES